MDQLDDDDQEINPDDLFGEIDKTVKEYKAIQDESIRYSQVAGFGIESLEYLRQNFTTILAGATDYEGIKPVIASGLDQLHIIRPAAQNIRQNLSDAFSDFAQITTSVYVTGSTSGSVANYINPNQTPAPTIPTFMLPEKNTILDVLNKLDPELARTYLEIDQVYYGTNASNVRGALAMARQTFDHFFDILSPNKKVKASQFWKPIKGKSPDLVTREQRVNYAISAHVKDPIHAATLVSSRINIIKTYKMLNRLHKRGKLNIKSEKQAIFAMKLFIENFARAIE